MAYSSDLGKQYNKYFLSPEFSDVTLIVENQPLPAHKLTLAARSEYFRDRFNELETSTKIQPRFLFVNEITLEETSLSVFKPILQYLYSDRIDLDAFDPDTKLNILKLGARYGLQKLTQRITDNMKEAISMKNVCEILNAAINNRMGDLMNLCLTFMDENAEKILQDESFLKLSTESLHELLCRDSFLAKEIDIFNAICRWYENNAKSLETNGESVIGKIMDKCLRLVSMTMEDLIKVLPKAPLVKCTAILDALNEKLYKNPIDLPFRGNMCGNEDAASKKFGAEVIEGTNGQALLDDTLVYDEHNGYAYSKITNDHEGITIQLKVPWILNHIKMLLWDREYRDNGVYSYYVEVSDDNKNWNKVVDYSTYHCRSWQQLYFEKRVIKYIKIVGTYNNHKTDKTLRLVSLEAKRIETIPKLVNDLIKPENNVALISLNAIVIEGIAEVNAIIDGISDELNSYTEHTIKGNPQGIVVQLPQPYMIDSLRMKLWDGDDKKYSYYIETSVDNSNWQIAVDKRNELTKSWQRAKFTMRPVVFIKIKCTKAEYWGGIYINHLECPDQQSD